MPPPTQAHQQAPRPPPGPPIDAAQAMLNLVLVQTGRFFREQNLRESPRAQDGMREAILPAAATSFHNNLDEIQIKLTRAQLVIRRDLARLQAQREKREAEEKEKAAAQAPKPKDASPQMPTEAVPGGHEKKQAAFQDVEMKGTETGASQDKSTNGDNSDSKPAENTTAKPTQPQKPPPIQTSSESKDVKSSDPNTADPPTATSLDDLFSGKTPTTANMNLDFDSMFEDATNATAFDGGNDDNSFDFGGLDENATGGSLLSGLEDYANSASSLPPMDDMAMPDISTEANSSAIPSAPETSTIPVTTQSQTQPSENVTADASNNSDMDDLFNFGGNEFGLDLDGNAPAPESTEFDDAFFGFD